MTPVDIGGVIRRTRERLGLSQEGLAALVGADALLLDQWEWGEASPTTLQRQRISEVLGIPMESLEPDEIVVDLAMTPAEPVDIRVEPAKQRRSARRTTPRRPLRKRAWGVQPGVPPVGIIPHLAPVFPGIRRHLAALGEDRPRLFVSIAATLAVILLALGVGTLIAGGREGSTAVELETENVRLAGELAAADADRGELAERVAGLESSIAGETERADAAVEKLGALEAENQLLKAENGFLRSAIVISSASPFVDLVALTFDGGASLQSVRRVIDVLDLKGATATFFPDGQNVASLPGLWELAIERGNELGNYTWAPVVLSEVTPGKLARQLTRWQEAADAVVEGVYPTVWFRPVLEGSPDLYESVEDTQKVLTRRNLLTALWSIDTPYSVYDPNGPQLAGSDPSADAVAEYLASAARAGSIIRIGFDDRDLEALPFLIDALRSRGLEPVTLTDLVEGQEDQRIGDVLPADDDAMPDPSAEDASS